MNRPFVAGRMVLAALAIALLATAPLMADIASPFGGSGARRPPIEPPVAPVAAESVAMQVRVDPQATQSVLTIPQKFLAKNQVGFDEPAPAQGIGIGRSVIAGLAMSIAVTGLFLMLRGRKSRAAIMLIVCGIALLAATKLLADLPPPGPVPPPKVDDNHHAPLTFALRAAAEGNVIIKIVTEGNAVTLVLAANDRDHAVPLVHAPNASSGRAPELPASGN